jgi:hypothetical protein
MFAARLAQPKSLAGQIDALLARADERREFITLLGGARRLLGRSRMFAASRVTR